MSEKSFEAIRAILGMLWAVLWIMLQFYYIELDALSKVFGVGG